VPQVERSTSARLLIRRGCAELAKKFCLHSGEKVPTDCCWSSRVGVQQGQWPPSFCASSQPAGPLSRSSVSRKSPTVVGSFAKSICARCALKPCNRSKKTLSANIAVAFVVLRSRYCQLVHVRFRVCSASGDYCHTWALHADLAERSRKRMQRG
jgi:hypothetical protein